MASRLTDQSSPYLRQHADNPVDWWPWGPEALAEAERRDVPILLSVGYSACHWCHVMAHESFEDPATAAQMNAGFVNVKVDREERPDVDAVYMQAVQAMTGAGGWPMTVFCAPDGAPFYGGTYFPPDARHGRPSFQDVLAAVTDAWANRRDELLEQADGLREAIGAAARLRPDDALPEPSAVDAAIERLRAAHDDEWGGFGAPPKFPTPQNVELFVRHLARTADPASHRVVETTLDAMASGGMYDHLGGGFARYSTDRRWVVPHFEKMLHDQAGLVRLYLHGHQVTGHQRYRQVVEETVAYVLRDLRLPGGGIASSEDADSIDADGNTVEGAFYVFTPGEVRGVLGDDADEAIVHYELDGPPDFEGRWIPTRTRHRGDWARTATVDHARRSLLAHRSARPRPGLDDKVLTEWNALWVSALAEAGAALARPDWVDAAVTTAEFALGHLRRDDGRWLRTWQADAGAKHLAFAGDLAAVIDACTRLAEATGEARWIGHARTAADQLIAHHWDDDAGGVFTTADDGEPLVTRDKDIQDGALPAANSMAALGLTRLAALTGHDDYHERARDILRLVAPLLDRAPEALGVAITALELHHHGITEIVVTGDRTDLVHEVQRRFLPDAVLAWGEPYDSPLWAGRDRPAAYVCRSYVCGLPADDVDELVAQLDR